MDIDKIEEKIDRTAAGSTAISMSMGGVQFRTMMELMEFAKMMAISKEAVPHHLRGNPGACLAICTRALRFGFDPFALAEHSFSIKKPIDVSRDTPGGGRVTEKHDVETIAYDSFVIRAIIQAHAPLTGSLSYLYEGEGDQRTVTVSAQRQGSREVLSLKSPTLGERKKAIGTNKDGKIKGSPLWETKPDQQLAYDTGRDFCRRHFPEVLLGWYDKDEYEQKTLDLQPAGDTATGLKDRLAGNKDKPGFSHDGVTKAIEHKPGEVMPDVTVKAAAEVVAPAKSPTAQKGPVAAVSAEPDKEPAKAETALQRGVRLLAGLKTAEDVNDLLGTIAEELDKGQLGEWQTACAKRLEALKPKTPKAKK